MGQASLVALILPKELKIGIRAKATKPPARRELIAKRNNLFIIILLLILSLTKNK